MTINEIIEASSRIGAELQKLSHDLAHVDTKSESVEVRALLSRLQRASHDTFLAFQNVLPR
jgi:hypothetical protein